MMVTRSHAVPAIAMPPPRSTQATVNRGKSGENVSSKRPLRVTLASAGPLTRLAASQTPLTVGRGRETWPLPLPLLGVRAKTGRRFAHHSDPYISLGTCAIRTLQSSGPADSWPRLPPESSAGGREGRDFRLSRPPEDAKGCGWWAIAASEGRVAGASRQTGSPGQGRARPRAAQRTTRSADPLAGSQPTRPLRKQRYPALPQSPKVWRGGSWCHRIHGWVKDRQTV